MNASRFSWTRWVSIIIKEFIQLKRDRLTFGMIVGIPVIQVLLFGFAINSDPKSLPTAVLSLDNGRYTRTIVSALSNTGYFRFVREATSMVEADELIERGRVQFVVTIPAGFERALVRGDRPQLLIEADATDPSATGNALAAVNQALTTALAHDLQGVTADLASGPAAVDVRIQRRFNPEGITAFNIVPGLLGVILTMTMVLMTGLAMTRERERGTFENLLATRRSRWK
jgi:ABC-2 type transport system permease protein